MGWDLDQLTNETTKAQKKSIISVDSLAFNEANRMTAKITKHYGVCLYDPQRKEKSVASKARAKAQSI